MKDTGYHHGDKSLTDTIVSMAQSFVGKNNINFLMPNGQFGTRLEGGSDAASPRYIHTMLNQPLVSLLFPKDDMKLLRYEEMDGMVVEPSFFVPILPLCLVNGVIGIATGFSSTIPNHNPEDVVKCVQQLLDEKKIIHYAPP